MLVAQPLVGSLNSIRCPQGVYVNKTGMFRRRRTSFMSSPLLIQKCPACFARQTWVMCENGSQWSYSCCFQGAAVFQGAASRIFQNKMQHSWIVPSSLFSKCFLKVPVVQPYDSTKIASVQKKATKIQYSVRFMVSI